MPEIKRIEPTAHVQSPFIKGTNVQFAWDSTSLGYIKTCPRLYFYIMIEGWSAKDESIHLRFGIEFHTALQEYEQFRASGKDHHEALSEVVINLLGRTFDWEVDTSSKAGTYKNRDSIIRTVIWYLDQHKNDHAKTYILKDGSPAVELSFRFELDWGPTIKPNQPYMLTGHLDKIVVFVEDLYVMDHKTTTIVPSQYYFNQFEPNNQMTLYTLASQVILQAPVKGVIINAAYLKVDSTEFVRGTTFRTKEQLNEWLNDLTYWFALAEGYAKANYWPMNDTACDKYGGCRFKEICSKSPNARKPFLQSKFTQLPLEERWNPLKPR